MYKFKIENISHDWPNPTISGEEVRSVPPGIPASEDLWLKEKGKKGRLIQLKDQVDLTDNGVEKFYTQNVDSSAG